MVLKDTSFVLRPEGFSNVFPLFRSQYNAAEVLVNSEVVIEEAAVLGHDVDRLSKDRP